MYSISGKFDNVMDVLEYTIRSMKEVGFDESEIEQYMIEAVSGHNAHLVDVSTEYINQCNDMLKQIRSESDDYYDSSTAYMVPRKYYWEDEEDDDDEDFYEGFSTKSYEYLNDDDDEDFYEGFSHSYKKYY